MADPSFEPGRLGESAVELGTHHISWESKAVDTESLCVLTGKLVWAIRVHLHILDNGGPDCTLGCKDGQQVILHPPEIVRIDQVVIHRYFHRTSAANSVGFCRIDNHLDEEENEEVEEEVSKDEAEIQVDSKSRRRIRQAYSRSICLCLFTCFEHF
ncbi:hypothetical protein ACFE04_013855 [Oxalis oulophora]